jgi:hypothetical protein
MRNVLSSRRQIKIIIKIISCLLGALVSFVFQIFFIIHDINKFCCIYFLDEDLESIRKNSFITSNCIYWQHKNVYLHCYSVVKILSSFTRKQVMNVNRHLRIGIGPGVFKRTTNKLLERRFIFNDQFHFCLKFYIFLFLL